ncbi:MAG: cation transporter, partial [Pseudomonadota bacterium]
YGNSREENMNERSFFRKKMTGLLLTLLVILTAAGAFAVKFNNNEEKPQPAGEKIDAGGIRDGEKYPLLSKLVLNVSNMSCSGCISTIKGALAGYQGIKDILVDLGSGKVEVYYDQEKLTDTTEIEKAITASGYPAKTLKTLSPEEIREELDLAASKAKYYIASVSGYDIARADFAMDLNAARQKFKKAYGDDLFSTDQGRALDNRLKAQVASRLIDEGILLNEIKRTGYELSEGTVNTELEKYLKESVKNEKEFQQSLEEVGYGYDYFKKKFETAMLINRYVDEKVLAGASTQYEKERLFQAWFNNSKLLADVVYYDKDLEQAIQNQNASGSCCSTR